MKNKNYKGYILRQNRYNYIDEEWDEPVLQAAMGEAWMSRCSQYSNATPYSRKCAGQSS